MDIKRKVVIQYVEICSVEYSGTLDHTGQNRIIWIIPMVDIQWAEKQLFKQ